MANRFSPAPSHGGGFRSGEPHLIVIHSLEAPARRGLAWDLANGWIKNAGVSPHSMTDPGETVDLLDLDTVGWHCGNGNQYSIGLEVTGYAAWSTEQWTTGDAFEALKLDAKRAAEVAKAKGIPLRWLSLAEIRAGARGFCTHADISATYAGTNHTDPGRGFPYALFMQLVQQYAGAPVAPGKNPNPQPGHGPGGADPTNDIEEYLSTVDDQKFKQLVHDGVEWALEDAISVDPVIVRNAVKDSISAALTGDPNFRQLFKEAVKEAVTWGIDEVAQRGN